MPPLLPSILASQEHSSTVAVAPMKPLVDPIETCLSSLESAKDWIIPLFRELGCITQDHFDALSCMMSTAHLCNAFRSGLLFLNEHAAPYLLQIEIRLRAHQLSLNHRPWAMPIQSRRSYTAVPDFLRNLRCSLIHHLDLFYAHGIADADQLSELCRQRWDGGLEIAFHVFARRGSMSYFEWLVLWEGLQTWAERSQIVSAHSVMHQALSLGKSEPVCNFHNLPWVLADSVVWCGTVGQCRPSY